MKELTISYDKRKTFVIRESGRSTDFISPSFGYGCLFNCSYCYMKRHKESGLSIANNYEDILSAINNHSIWLDYPKIPNQTHEIYYTYDISCNEDFALHLKLHNWRKIFDFFKNDNNIMGSFATKYVNKNLLDYNPNKKIRIRFSLIPENLRQILEPNTTNISNRIKAIDKFIEKGYEVHLNFSPVVVYKDWIKDYNLLFEELDKNVINKNEVKAEVIFLTHNIDKHKRNLYNKLEGEDFLWNPKIQENKVSQYGGLNIRYERNLKRNFINKFIEVHDNIIKWNTIRYIF